MDSSGRRRAAVVLSVTALVLALIALTRLGAGGGTDDVNRLPSIELLGPDDTLVSTDELIGVPLVINFWYSACPPCANELRHFAAVEDEYGDRVRFVGINAIDTVDEMTAFAGERGVAYELFQDPLAELQTQMRLTSFPTTLFVSADGSIIERTGVLDESGLTAQVDALLAADR